MDIWIGCYFAVLFAVTIGYEFAISRSVEQGYDGFQTRKAICLLMALMDVCVFFVILRFRWPFPVLLALLFASACLSMRSLLFQSQTLFWFWVTLRVIHFASGMMIATGLVSLFQGISLREAYQNSNLWMGFTLAVWLTLTVFTVVKNCMGAKEHRKMMFRDEARLRPLVVFEWFALGYLAFDSIPCMFELPYRLISWFLVGSSALILVQIYLLIFHTERLVYNAHYESEYHRLEQERSEEIRKEMELRNLAYTDGLTGANTRRFAIEVLDSLLLDGQEFSLAYIDINGLKRVNDTFGHIEGDRYLRMTARMLNQILRRTDTFARIGGDEFLVIAPGTSGEELNRLMEAANQKLREQEESWRFIPSFSYGISEAGAEAALSADQLVRQADERMYRQKKGLRLKMEGAV